MDRTHSHTVPDLHPELVGQSTSPWLLDALKNLNEIGRSINNISSSSPANLEPGLRLIVESAVKVIPGASAVIYSLGQVTGSTFANGFPGTNSAYRRDRKGVTFEFTASAATAGEADPITRYGPRPDGLGARSVQLQRRVLSYEETDLSISPLKVQAGAKTVACFPLIAADQVAGLLYIYLREERNFSPVELLMLENFVNLAAMALYQKHQMAVVQRVLDRKDEELYHLRRAGLLISSRPRLEETLEAILQMALEVTNAQYGIFRLTDKTGQVLITRAIAGDRLAQPLVDALPVSAKSIMGWVATNRQPVLIHDLQSPPWADLYYPLDADLVMRSELAVPLVGTSGRLEGVLNLESPEAGAFSEADSHLLQALATQAMVAIQEARLLDALQEVAQILLIQPYQDVLDHLVEQACSLLNAAASVIWIRKQDGYNPDYLILTSASTGYDPQHPGVHRNDILPLKNSLAGLAISSRTPVFSEDIRFDERFNRRDVAVAQGWKQALIVPVLASSGGASDSEQEIAPIGAPVGAPVGAFSIYRSESDMGTFTESEWDVKVLTCLAHYAALAVHNAARQEKLRSIQERNALAETFAAVGDIAANLLHNLNNKVGVIPVRVQGIQDKCWDALQADPYLESSLAEIERSAIQAMAFVRENLSHLHPIQMTSVSIASSVRNAIQQVSLPETVQVSLEGLDDLPLVTAGEKGLELVFTNLLENAIVAMDGEGWIQISGASVPGWVEVFIHDSGSGISPELHNVIFEFNYSNLSKSRPGKLGFGLWWVKSIMNRLGGTVNVESDGSNGCTFRLRLPCCEGNDEDYA